MNKIPFASRIIEEGNEIKTITVFSNDTDGTVTTEVDVFDRVTESKTTEQHEVFGTDGVRKRIFGWQDFADTATTNSPIVQSNINGGEALLVNNNSDTLTDGTTNVNLETTVEGVNDLWNTSSNSLVFGDTGIELNDVIELRVHLNVLSSIIDQAFDVRLDFYDQTDGQGNLMFSLKKQLHVETLSAGVFREKMVDHSFFVGQSILNGSCKLYIEGTKSFEVEVIGFNLRITKIAR